jgi:hypothetical protein
MKAKGKAYEKKVLLRLSLEIHSLKCSGVVHPWIGYEEPLGRKRAAQPDVVLFNREYLVVLEIKLSRCEAGFLQIEHLYAPLLTKLYDLPVAGCVIFCNPGRGYAPYNPPIRRLSEVSRIEPGSIAEWHLLI